MRFHQSSDGKQRSFVVQSTGLPQLTLLFRRSGYRRLLESQRQNTGWCLWTG